MTGFVHAISVNAHKKYLAQKVARLGFLRPIPMFKHAFCSSCPALQYVSGITFYHQTVPEIHGIENQPNFSTTMLCLYVV